MPTDAYDTIVIGSGFGGGVSALRLAESGRRVAVLEMGRRVTPEHMRAAATSTRSLMWAPRTGMRGFYRQTLLAHVLALGGVGVGGGSLVYAGVLLQPDDTVFDDPAWAGADWRSELGAHYATAAAMLGRQVNPTHGEQDEWLAAAADSLGVGHTYAPTPQGIDFSRCTSCGRCLTGCDTGAKRSIDHTYLAAAQRLGARVVPERTVRAILPRRGGGYTVQARDSFRRGAETTWTAQEVVVAAGVLGTVELLLACRDRYRTLPDLSPALGRTVRTNSETFVAVLQADDDVDVSVGPTISSDFWIDEHTHVTNNRLPPSMAYLRNLTAPLADGPTPTARLRSAVGQAVRSPATLARAATASDWHRRTTLLTVMQSRDNALDLVYRRRAGVWTLTSRLPDGATAPPSYLPQANAAARAVARASGGTPYGLWVDVLLRRATTAHILGGAVVGESPASSVVSPQHEVHGYPGLYIVDGSTVPANIGVNPSLTITAMAERAMTALAGRS